MSPAQMSLSLSIHQSPHHAAHMTFLKHRKNIENRRFCYTIHPFSTYHRTSHINKSLHGFFRFCFRCITMESYDIRVGRQEIIQFLIAIPHTRRDRLFRINLPCPYKNLAQQWPASFRHCRISWLIIQVPYKNTVIILKRFITSFTYFSNLPCVRSSTTIEYPGDGDQAHAYHPSNGSGCCPTTGSVFTPKAQSSKK